MPAPLDKAAAFRSADKAWDDALIAAFGRGAARARYSEKGAGAPGSALRKVYSDRYRAYAAWCEACGMVPYADPRVEPLADDEAAKLAGWQFDQESAAEGEWPWFRTMAEDDGRCVMRNGEWRLYVETAAEALAETAGA